MKRKTVKGKVIGKNEKLTLKEAVKMYTVYGSYASFEETVKGTIEEGKDADLVILPEGFMSYSAEQIKEAEVIMTVIDGEIVYEDNTI
jgi:hypothetical protein